MRRLLTALLLAAPLGGCALQPGPRSGRAIRDVPLQARIVPDFGGRQQGLAFTLNRPAHVALFEIIPGRGVGLMYPSLGRESDPLPSGFHRSILGAQNVRWAYQQGLAPSSRTQPRYYYLVASEWPLNTDRFVGSPAALRSALGLRFASYSPSNVLEEIDRVIAPGVQGEWTSDVYVVWPYPPVNDPVARQVVVRCPDGRAVLVPLRYVALACPNVDRSGTRPAVAGEDREGKPGVERPERKRPEGRRPVPAPAGTGELRPERPAHGQPSRPDRERPRPDRPQSPSEPRTAPQSEPSSEPRSTPRVEPRSEPSPRSEPRPERPASPVPDAVIPG
jgi:hypothetical protein